MDVCVVKGTDERERELVPSRRSNRVDSFLSLSLFYLFFSFHLFRANVKSTISSKTEFGFEALSDAVSGGSSTTSTRLRDLPEWMGAAEKNAKNDFNEKPF